MGPPDNVKTITPTLQNVRSVGFRRLGQAAAPVLGKDKEQICRENGMSSVPDIFSVRSPDWMRTLSKALGNSYPEFKAEVQAQIRGVSAFSLSTSVVPKHGCTLDSPGSFKKNLCLGPTSRDSDVIGLGCGWIFRNLYLPR